MEPKHPETEIFISYARADRDRVETLVRSLEAANLRVWWDPELRGGQRFSAAIDEALAAARCVIVVWSETSVESDWVQSEADEARRQDKLLPIFIDEVVPPLEFRRLHTVTLVDWANSGDTKNLERLIAEILERLTPPEDRGAVEEKRVEAGKRFLTRLSRRRLARLLVVASVLAAAIGVAFVVYLRVSIPAVDVERVADTLLERNKRTLAEYQMRQSATAEYRDELRAAISHFARLTHEQLFPWREREALRKLEYGDTESAEQILLAAEEAPSKSADVERYKAAEAARSRASLALLRDDALALAALEKAMELDPDNPEGWRHYGFLLSVVKDGAPQRAERAYRALIQLGERTDDRALIALGYANMGNITESRGDVTEAENWYCQALHVYKGLEAGGRVADGYVDLGNLYLEQGQLQPAKHAYEAAGKIYLRQDLQIGLVAIYASLASIDLMQENFSDAETKFNRSLKISKTLGYREGEARAYSGLGLIAERRGDLQEAEAYHDQSRKIEEQEENLRGAAKDYGNLANVYVRRCESSIAQESDGQNQSNEESCDTAEGYGLKAQEMEMSLGRPAGVADSYTRLGYLYSLRGEHDAAEQMHSRALEWYQKNQMKPDMANEMVNLAVLRYRQDDVAEAQRYLCEALILYRVSGREQAVRELIDQIGVPPTDCKLPAPMQPTGIAHEHCLDGPITPGTSG